MRTVVLVAVGGAVGALARAVIVAAFGEQPWWGTLLVNVLGCLAIGYLLVTLQGSPRASTWWPFAVTGVLGGFTTFSALAVETVVLASDTPVLALTYVVATLVVGLVAVPLGASIAGRR